jgi:hypothetical protein
MGDSGLRAGAGAGAGAVGETMVSADAAGGGRIVFSSSPSPLLFFRLVCLRTGATGAVV